MGARQLNPGVPPSFPRFLRGPFFVLLVILAVSSCCSPKAVLSLDFCFRCTYVIGYHDLRITAVSRFIIKPLYTTLTTPLHLPRAPGAQCAYTHQEPESPVSIASYLLNCRCDGSKVKLVKSKQYNLLVHHKMFVWRGHTRLGSHGGNSQRSKRQSESVSYSVLTPP
jgi:hypothetical protein